MVYKKTAYTQTFISCNEPYTPCVLHLNWRYIHIFPSLLFFSITWCVAMSQQIQPYKIQAARFSCVRICGAGKQTSISHWCFELLKFFRNPISLVEYITVFSFLNNFSIRFSYFIFHLILLFSTFVCLMVNFENGQEIQNGMSWMNFEYFRI